MRHFFSAASSNIDKRKWIQAAPVDEALWKGATLLMLVVVTAIVALLSR
jgi:hypothetical protein